MKQAGKYAATKRRSNGCGCVIAIIVLLCLLAGLAFAGAYYFGYIPESGQTETEPVQTQPTEPPTEAPTTEPTEPPHNWQPGFVAAQELSAEYYDENGTSLGTLTRGTPVEFEVTTEGKTSVLINETIGYLEEGAYAVSQLADCIPEHTLYVRTAVNLRDSQGRMLLAFAESVTFRYFPCAYPVLPLKFTLYQSPHFSTISTVSPECIMACVKETVSRIFIP